MAKKNYRRSIFIALKILLSVAALIFVLRKTDYGVFPVLFRSCNPVLIIPALLLFVFSKYVSAVRLNFFLNDVGLPLTGSSNLKLYLSGMFWNLFLPGGIGGDGYKVYFLNKTGLLSIGKISLAIITDRVSGMIALLIFISAGLQLLPITGEYWIYALPAVLLILMVYYFIVSRFLTCFFENSGITTLLSLGIQILQILSMIFIVLSLNMQDNLFELITLFLVSSVVSVLPVSIGGMGLRELVFLYGSKFLEINESASVAISLIFFLITIMVSSLGIYYMIVPQKVELKTAV